MDRDAFHIPVLLSEVTKGLAISEGKKYVEATVGGGGHTEEILREGGIVLGIDCDPEAIEHVGRKVKNNLTLVRENFAHLKEIGKRTGFEKVAGILFDLGVSSHQLETDYRGFSFNTNAPLDMRMDPTLSVTAADLVNGLNEGELDELFKKYSEEYHSRAIARAIVRARAIAPIATCNQLAEVVIKARRQSRFERTPACRRLKHQRLAGRHPAMRVFQALRIAVNDELNNLRQALPQAVELLEKGGRLVVLSFHSLEDRIVKNFFKEKEKKGILQVLTKKPIRPSREEIKANPRSRSAKLRIAEKL